MELGVPWELVGPDGSRAVLNDREDPDFVGFTDEVGVTGLGEAEVREDADVLSDRDGGVHGDFYRGRMPIVVQGMLDPNVDIATSNMLETKLRRATKAFRGDGTLAWTPTGSVRRMVWVRAQQPVRITGLRPKRFQLALVSASHRVVTAAESNQAFAAGGAGGEIGFTSPISDPLTSAIEDTGAALIANVGDEPSSPRFRIDGPITNPTLRNATTGEELRLITQLLAGEWLDVLVETREVLLNGTIDRYSAVQFPGSTWWELQPGANDIRLLAIAFSAPAALTVFWRSAWA